jgi:predicted signal transduction protein with EAL and GGDEF domain
MQESLDPPFLIAGREFRVGASAGVAVAPPAEVGHLLASADLALYRAKSEGRRQCRLFDPAMRERYVARRALEEEVSRAARGGEFELHFQPQISLGRGVLIGAEALLRWRHPKPGLLPPAAFLDALEAGSMAGAVGDWVIEEGCRQAAAWREQGLALRVGVNLFAEQIRAGNLEATVRAALDRWALPASALELELTETIALRHDDELLAPLHALHAHGVGVALDDFGTGFASLSMLRRCPLSRLKIDRGFVSELGTEGPLTNNDIDLLINQRIQVFDSALDAPDLSI